MPLPSNSSLSKMTTILISKRSRCEKILELLSGGKRFISIPPFRQGDSFVSEKDLIMDIRVPGVQEK